MPGAGLSGAAARGRGHRRRPRPRRAQSSRGRARATPACTPSGRIGSHHALWRARSPARRPAGLAAGPGRHRDRDPPGATIGPALLHRPRHGRRDRRDRRGRRRRHALPRRHARRPQPAQGQAPPDARRRRGHRRRREGARPDHDRARARRSAPTRSSSGTCRTTPSWSASPGRCGSCPPPRPGGLRTPTRPWIPPSGSNLSEWAIRRRRRHRAARRQARRAPRRDRGRVRGPEFSTSSSCSTSWCRGGPRPRSAPSRWRRSCVAGTCRTLTRLSDIVTGSRRVTGRSRDVLVPVPVRDGLVQTRPDGREHGEVAGVGSCLGDRLQRQLDVLVGARHRERRLEPTVEHRPPFEPHERRVDAAAADRVEEQRRVEAQRSRRDQGLRHAFHDRGEPAVDDDLERRCRAGSLPSHRVRWPIASNTGSAVVRTVSGPAARTTSWPCSAGSLVPSTGESTKTSP